jgi:hybrid cluster-associated redox disulfide protein
MTVSELIECHPSAITVFIKRKMLCVGCPAEKFHTVEEAASIYNIKLEHLLKDLREVIEPKV